jgi:hypothetical protein
LHLWSEIGRQTRGAEEGVEKSLATPEKKPRAKAQVDFAAFSGMAEAMPF